MHMCVRIPSFPCDVESTWQAQEALAAVKEELQAAGQFDTAELFGTWRPQLLLSMALMALQQLTGNAAILSCKTSFD